VSESTSSSSGSASITPPFPINQKISDIVMSAQPPVTRVTLRDQDGAVKATATVLTEIGSAHHLFHNEENDAYARVAVGGHHEVFKVESENYRDLLSRAYYELSGKGANTKSIGDAVATLKAMARYDGPCEPVHFRTGAYRGGIALDIGSKDWSIIHVTPKGWSVEKRHTVNFRRSNYVAALPVPGVSHFDLLWKYVNIAPVDRVLVAGWLLATLRPDGPFPIMLLIGEQGTGKSNSSRTLKDLTDPSSVPLRAPPRDDQDLLVSALNSWVLALDNLSGATPQLSDALCRLATGGALASRKLYTNAEEAAYDIKRPVILNGIDDLASRPDLAERCVHLTLPPLTTRTTEREMVAQFREDAPKIMAALLDGLVLALRDVDSIDIGDLPRMADFAKWAAAGVPALGFPAQAFIHAYRLNQSEAVALGLDSSVVASALRSFAEHEGRWTGTADELLKRLKGQVGIDRDASGWPHTAKGLQMTLRRLAPSLRSIGIEVERSRTAEKRWLTVSSLQPGAPL
jgi:hypothetical protein